jgi:anti-anti-sigma regulatory factor
VIDAVTALETSRGRLVVECAALESFDEDGIALLIGLSRYSEGRKIRVELVNPPDDLRQNLEFRGLAWLFDWRPLCG